MKRGVRHLHELNLVHNDLNPSNLMIDHDNVPRIIDFDSCQKTGQPLGYTRGTRGWSDEDAEFARWENDFSGLDMIRDYLFGHDLSVGGV